VLETTPEPAKPPPSIIGTTIRITLGHTERSYYNALYKRISTRVKQYVLQTTLQANYTRIHAGITILRHACCHPSLVTAKGMQFSDFISSNVSWIDTFASPAKQTIRKDQHVLDRIPRPILQRLLAHNIIHAECPICFELVGEEGLINGYCGHVFCPGCLKLHGRNSEKTTCPECRGKLDVKFTVSTKTFYDMYVETLPQVDLDDEDDELPEVEFGNFDSLMTVKQEYDSTVDDYDCVNSSKTTALLELLQSISHSKVVVVCSIPSFADVLEERMDAIGLVHYNANLPLKQRKRNVDLFSQASAGILLTNLQPIACDEVVRVILVDYWANSMLEVDILARFPQRTHIYRLVTMDTIEERAQSLSTSGKLSTADMEHLFQ
jgi:SNF2 family DNA or RNA helicase